jgi:acyl carrier protein
MWLAEAESDFETYRMVDRKAVLEAMAEFFAENFPNVPRDQLESMKASEVIQQSLDLVEFVLHLEEKLGLEININTLGEKLITKTFGELADDLVSIGNQA